MAGIDSLYDKALPVLTCALHFSTSCGTYVNKLTLYIEKRYTMIVNALQSSKGTCDKTHVLLTHFKSLKFSLGNFICHENSKIKDDFISFYNTYIVVYGAAPIRGDKMPLKKPLNYRSKQ